MGNIVFIIMTIILVLTAAHAKERDQIERDQQWPHLCATGPSPLRAAQTEEIQPPLIKAMYAKGGLLAFGFLTIYDLLRFKSVSKEGHSIVEKLPRFLVNELYASHQLLKPENPTLPHLETLQGVLHLMLWAIHEDVWKDRLHVCRKILERCEAQGNECVEGTLALQTINTFLNKNDRQYAFDTLLTLANGNNARAQEYILMLSLWTEEYARRSNAQEAALNLTVTDKALDDPNHPLNLWRQNCLIEPLIWLANRAAPLSPKEPFCGKSHWAFGNALKRLPFPMLGRLLDWGVEQTNRGVDASTPNEKLPFFSNALLACKVYLETLGNQANAKVHCLRGFTLKNLGTITDHVETQHKLYTDALASFNTYCEIMEKQGKQADADVHIFMGFTLTNLGTITDHVETQHKLYTEALASYTTYCERMKKQGNQADADVHRLRGFTLKKLGNITHNVETKHQHYTEALASFKTYCECIEKQGKQADAEVHIFMGQVHYNLCGAVERLEDKQKTLQDAIACYKTYQTLRGDATEPMILKEIEVIQKKLEVLGENPSLRRYIARTVGR